MKMKKFIIPLLVLLCVFALAACQNNSETTTTPPATNDPGAHVHNYKSVVTAPTCTAGGYTTYTCDCGDSYVGDETDPVAHDYETVVTAPTCAAGGYTTYTCKVCGDSYVGDKTDASAHDYETVVTAPTCAAGGYTTYTCKVCGESHTADEVAALEHDYETVVTAPTCAAKGYTTYTCKVCNESHAGDEVPALEHNYETKVTKPTCTVAGYTTYTCKTCGDVTYGNRVPSIGHKYEVAVTAPTCAAKGYTTYTCRNCDESIRCNYVDALAHTKEILDAKAPTCTATGLTEGVKCSVCEKILVEQEVIPMLVHADNDGDGKCDNGCGGDIKQLTCDHTFGDGVVTEPTCKDGGYTTYTCTKCGHFYTGNETEKSTEHTWGDWEITEAATATQNGTRKRTCKYCPETETQSYKIVYTKLDGMPEAGKAYKFGLFQANATVNKLLYATGNMSSNFFAATDDVAQAADIYIEATDGGCRLYLDVNGAHKYISVYQFWNTKKNKVGNSQKLVDSADEACVFVWNSELNVFTVTLTYEHEGNSTTETYYLGTYGNYQTISASSTYFITGDNAATIGVTQYPAYFYAEQAVAITGEGGESGGNETGGNEGGETGGNEGGETKPSENTTLTISIADLASKNGWSNGEQIKSFTESGITFEADGGQNTGKYYNNGSNWRFYQTETPSLTISAEEGKTIISVKITYTFDKNGVLTCGETQITSGTVVEVNASTVTFGVGNSGTAENGQVQITAIEVVYA